MPAPPPIPPEDRAADGPPRDAPNHRSSAVLPSRRNLTPRPPPLRGKGERASGTSGCEGNATAYDARCPVPPRGGGWGLGKNPLLPDEEQPDGGEDNEEHDGDEDDRPAHL